MPSIPKNEAGFWSLSVRSSAFARVSEHTHEHSQQSADGVYRGGGDAHGQRAEEDLPLPGNVPQFSDQLYSISDLAKSPHNVSVWADREDDRCESALTLLVASHCSQAF